MSVRERLSQIQELIKLRLYHVADEKVDALYEEYTHGTLQMTYGEEADMFRFISTISNKLYGNKKIAEIWND